MKIKLNQFEDWILLPQDTVFDLLVKNGFHRYDGKAHREYARAYNDTTGEEIMISYSSKSECKSLERRLFRRIDSMKPRKYADHPSRNTTTVRISWEVRNGLEQLRTGREPISKVIETIYEFYMKNHR